MQLQRDKEFNQNEIAEIKKKYSVLHYNSKLNDGHVAGIEQKNCKLKSRLRNFKRLVKKGRLKPNEALKNQLITLICYLPENMECLWKR